MPRRYTLLYMEITMSDAEKRNALIGAAVLGVIVIGLALWYMATHQPRVVTPNGETPQATTTPTSYEKKTITKSDRFFDAEVSYPAATPLRVSAGATADANAVASMKTFAEGQIEAFKERSGFDQFTQEDIDMLGFNQGRKYALDIDYTTAQSPWTVSYVFTIYEDTMGAHPNGYLRTYTFNKKTGEALGLDDLFTGPYLDRLSELSRAKLKASISAVSGGDADVDYINSGTLPIADSFQNFYLEGDTFVLVFPPYQVGPYALGIQEARIPMMELSGFLKSSYLPVM